MSQFKKSIFLILLLFIAIFAEEAQVNANSLNVRESPNSKSKVITKLKKGDITNVYTCTANDFCLIKFGSVTGYVSKKYLVSTDSYNEQENTNTQQIEEKAPVQVEEVGIGWKIGLFVILAIAIGAVIHGAVNIGRDGGLFVLLGLFFAVPIIIGIIACGGVTEFILLIQNIIKFCVGAAVVIFLISVFGTKGEIIEIIVRRK